MVFAVFSGVRLFSVKFINIKEWKIGETCGSTSNESAASSNLQNKLTR